MPGNKGLNAEGEIGVVAGAVSPGKWESWGDLGLEWVKRRCLETIVHVRALYSELLAFLSK